MLELKDLTVTVQDRKEAVVRSFNLTIKEGETHILMGPNGAGKSSIAHAIIGNKKYRTKGRIIFNGEDITNLKTNERAKKGIFLAFQNPEEIEGVSLSIMLRKTNSSIHGTSQTIDQMLKLQDKMAEKATSLGLAPEFIKRAANVGFSGGEKKRSEMLQIAVLEPKLVVLDEIDSGLDIDGIKLVAKQIKKLSNKKRSFLIITHNPRIVRYIKPKFVHVMVDGKIIKSGSSKLAQEIERKGFEQIKSGRYHVRC